MCFMRLDEEELCRFQRKTVGDDIEILCGTSQMGLNRFLTERGRALPAGAPAKLPEVSSTVMKSGR